MLASSNIEICLLEKRAGSAPAPGSNDQRRFERHWTPVHLDFEVDDLRAALERAEALGARREQLFENTPNGSVAFCCDPFGHGFCLIERKTPG